MERQSTRFAREQHGNTSFMWLVFHRAIRTWIGGNGAANPTEIHLGRLSCFAAYNLGAGWIAGWWTDLHRALQSFAASWINARRERQLLAASAQGLRPSRSPEQLNHDA